MTCLPSSPAARRYTRRFVPTMTAYIVFIMFVAWYIPRFHPAAPINYLLAILPAIPILIIILVVGRYLAEEQDEFQRNVLIQSMLWSLGFTLAITTVWGFLEMFTHIQTFNSFMTFPLFWFFVGVITPILKGRYR